MYTSIQVTIAVPFFLVDVFAERPPTGNPLALVVQAERPDEALLRAVAREFSQPETTFLLPPTASGATWRLRSFTLSGGGEGAGRAGRMRLAVAGRVGRGTCLRSERGRHRPQLGSLDDADVHARGALARHARRERGQVVRVLDDVQVAALDEAGAGAELLVEPWPALAGLERQRPLAGVAALLAHAASARPRSARLDRGRGLLEQPDPRPGARQVIGDGRAGHPTTHDGHVDHRHRQHRASGDPRRH
jgi:hypothetical protein